MRLGTGLALLWIVFWTCAYIIKPQSLENASSLPPALSPPTDIVLIVATIVGVPWIVSGFRSD
jgi:hypothetical protein